MQLKEYFKYFSLAFTALPLFVFEIPSIKTIGPGSPDARQLLTTLGELAGGAKDNLVEMATWPSGFFHENDNNQSPIIHDPPPPPASPPPEPPLDSPPEIPLDIPPEIPLDTPPEPLPEPPPESPPELLRPPEPAPMAYCTSSFLRVDGSKVIILLDLARVPGFDVMRRVVVWVAYWIGAAFSGGSGVGRSYWSHFLVTAAFGFFGGLGYGLGGWLRWYLSSREPPRAVEEVTVPKQPKRRTLANAYCECLLRDFW